MPIYEYRCGGCGRRSSALLASFSAPDPTCPHCGQAALTRLVSTFATVRSSEVDFGGDGGGDFGGDDEFGAGDYGGGGDFGGDDDW